jgi:Domain of Unknown Function (DUF326)
MVSGFRVNGWLMGGEDLSESYEDKTGNLDKRRPDYIEEVAFRNMRGIDEKSSSKETEDEEQTKEDADEGWENQNQSPLAGRISRTMEELERIQSSEIITTDEVRECIKDSLDCYQNCTETIIKCLSMGGKHTKYKHLNLLMDCAKICSTNAEFMLRNSTYYPQICGITADICDECADSCDRFDEDFMKECASVCRRCAESCREMAR